VTARPLVAVLDYGIGNLRSAQKTLELVGADARLTADHDVIGRAHGVVLPGVGAFGACMRAVAAAGLTDVARDAAASGRPFLGICVGAQMLFAESDESPGVAGLGLLDGRIVPLPSCVRRPQMQWNRLELTRPDHPLFDRLPGAPWMYFVHSYAPAVPAGSVLATCDYGGTVTAAAGSGSVAAVQFHPEKSGRDGQALLRGYLDWIAAA
jgi:glutamine amidotransferase